MRKRLHKTSVYLESSWVQLLATPVRDYEPECWTPGVGGLMAPTIGKHLQWAISCGSCSLIIITRLTKANERQVVTASFCRGRNQDRIHHLLIITCGDQHSWRLDSGCLTQKPPLLLSASCDGNSREGILGEVFQEPPIT